MPSGFADFDKMTHGLHGGEMVVIAGRPSMGKTSLAMNIAEHVAGERAAAGGVFSLEMTAESLIVRMLCRWPGSTAVRFARASCASATSADHRRGGQDGQGAVDHRRHPAFRSSN